MIWECEKCGREFESRSNCLKHERDCEGKPINWNFWFWVCVVLIILLYGGMGELIGGIVGLIFLGGIFYMVFLIFRWFFNLFVDNEKIRRDLKEDLKEEIKEELREEARRKRRKKKK